MTALLNVQLLGEFRLSYGDTIVNALNSPRLQSLVAYLLLHRHASQSRRHLAFLFWPDSTESQAQTNLRNLLHRLRQAWPEADQFLDIDDQTVQWQLNGPFTLDVANFEEAMNQPDAWQQVIHLYQGDLLPSCYEEWILAKREQLRQAFSEALERSLQFLEGQRDYSAAIHCAQRLLQHDPLQEGNYRHLMRLYAINNDRASALRVYHNCAIVLQRELEVEPSPATHELYKSLVNLERQSLPVPASTTLAAELPLVGRNQEWETLQKLWRTTVKGQAHFLLITGEAGIGKTRLAEELSGWVQRQGISVASAHCYAAGGRLAYAPVVTWLQADPLRATLSTLADIWLAEVARLLPDLLVERPHLPQPGPLTEGWQRRRLFEALARATLACTGKSQPLLLQIDDLQWCDQETLEWLAYLLHFEPQAPLLIVGTLRSEEIEPSHPVEALLPSLRREQQLTGLELRPLDPTETTALATKIANKELSPGLAEQLYQDTEGNPLFIVEMARAKFTPDTGAIQQEERASTPASSIALPPRVHLVIKARLAQLSPPAQKLASLAATIGRAFTFEVLAQATGENEASLIQGLDELWQRRIVREQGVDAYDFSHDKIREVAYTALSAAQRRLYHRRVAEALEAVHVSNLVPVAGQIASHYEQARLPRQAIPYYQQAAVGARQIYANREALHYYRLALALLEQVPATDADKEWRSTKALQLYEEMGDVLGLIGHHDEARLSYQQALALPISFRPIKQSRLQRKIGNTWRSQHQYEAALQAYNLAENVQEQQTGQPLPEQQQEWVQIQLERMWVYYWLNQRAEIGRLVEQARPLVEQYGTSSQQINFFLSLGSMHARDARYVMSEEILAIVKTAQSISQISGTAGEIAWVQFVLGFYLLWSGDLNGAEKEMQAALQAAEQSGDVVHQSRCLIYLAVVYRKRSLVEKVRDYATRSLAAAKAAQMQEYVGTAEANLAWIAWYEGNVAEAQAHGQAALTAWRQLPAGHASCCFQWTALWPLIGVSIAQHQTAIAVDYAHDLLNPPQQRLPEIIEAVLAEALHAWEQALPEVAASQLEQALAMAQKMNYL